MLWRHAIGRPEKHDKRTTQWHVQIPTELVDINLCENEWRSVRRQEIFKHDHLHCRLLTEKPPKARVFYQPNTTPRTAKPRTTPHPIPPYRTLPHSTVQHRTALPPTVLYRTLLYRKVPFHLPFPILPYSTPTNRTLQYRTVPYPTLLYPCPNL